MKPQHITAVLAGVATLALVGVAANGQGVRQAAALTQVSVAEKADNFRLVDHDSKSHELFYFKSAPAIVIITQQNGSQHVRDAAPAIKELTTAYAAKGVPVFLLNSSQSDNRDTIGAEMKALGLDLPVLLDDTQLIGEGLGVSRVAQALVIDPKTWKVAYSGPIDDRFAGKTAKPKAKVKKAYVANAVDDLLANRAVKVSTAKLESPALSFPARENRAEHINISYANDVAPILAKNCVACHTEGGIGPFAMSSYEMVKGFAPMIRESLRTDRMPPYNADPHVGDLKDDMNLSNAEARTLVHWIEAGAPRGSSATDPLLANAKPAPEWELGEPDYVITLPAYVVPASGIVDYQNPEVANQLPQGRWLRASQVKAGDRQAVHHLLSNGVGGYAVGAETTVYPEGTGSWVGAGQKHTFQMHYTPYGKETTDITRVGLYFYPEDKPPEVIRRSAVIANVGIEIPPGEARHQETAYITFPAAATLYTIFPHAHYRGENARFWIKKPGGEEEMVLSLPKYDFNWQRGYDFAEPLQLPAGTKLISRYEYDNSAHNPSNPDPTVRVTWGEQSHEEMQYTALGFRWNDETSSNLKPEYMEQMNASRTLGMLDSNVDGRIAKSELRGRIGTQISSRFDMLDANKDGFIADAELTAISGVLNRRIAEGQAQQSIGQ